MAKEVRVGDTVNLRLANGQFTTAEVLVVTTQDDLDLVYYNPHRVEVDNAVRATDTPAAVDEFYKEA
jgi:hypothetical protein